MDVKIQIGGVLQSVAPHMPSAAVEALAGAARTQYQEFRDDMILLYNDIEAEFPNIYQAVRELRLDARAELHSRLANLNWDEPEVSILAGLRRRGMDTQNVSS